MSNVCLSNAADVVPIADARMRWPGVSSNSERSDGLLEHQTTERLGRYDGMARQGKQSSKPRKVGPTFVSEPHLQLRCILRTSHALTSTPRVLSYCFNLYYPLCNHRAARGCDCKVFSSFWDRMASDSSGGCTVSDKETTSHIKNTSVMSRLNSERTNPELS